MKNKVKYLLYCCNVILIGLIVFNIYNQKLTSEVTNTSTLSLDDRRFISYLLIDNPLKDENILSKNDDKEEIFNSIEKEAKDKKLDDKKSVVSADDKSNDEEIIANVKEDEKVIETLIGSLAGYGPDCYGCFSNRTASGKYIGEGNIYYDDATYGRVRIVAGDYSYPFGTIVKISNVDFYNDEPFYAIVLDRGGDIGKNGKFLFDLLFASEKDALGREINIKFEIMRLGY